MKRHQQTTISSFFAKIPKAERNNNSDLESVCLCHEVAKDEENEVNEAVVEHNISHTPDDDIASYLLLNLNDNEKIDALNKIKSPPPHFNFPAVMRGSKIIKFSDR